MKTSRFSKAGFPTLAIFAALMAGQFATSGASAAQSGKGARRTQCVRYDHKTSEALALAPKAQQDDDALPILNF